MKSKLTGLLAVLLFSGIFNYAFSQELKLSGTVKNRSTGEAMQGATVSIKGTSQAVGTDAEGKFSITAPKKGSTLVISFAGMQTENYTVGSNTGNIVILMESSATSNLDEVVVIGYGTQKVTKVSGAISTVKAADIQKLNPVRVEEALQGRAAGVSVIQSG